MHTAATILLDVVAVIEPTVDAVDAVCQWLWAGLTGLSVLHLAALVDSSGLLASRDYQILGDFHMQRPLWHAVPL